MGELAAGTPTGAVLTYVFPVTFFVLVLIWFVLQRRDESVNTASADEDPRAYGVKSEVDEPSL